MYKKPKAILRAEAYTSLQTSFARILSSHYAYQNCLNCKNWDNKNDQCGKFKSKPPTEILIYSCEVYEDYMDIPF